jgi:hypothetical protein
MQISFEALFEIFSASLWLFSDSDSGSPCKQAPEFSDYLLKQNAHVFYVDQSILLVHGRRQSSGLATKESSLEILEISPNRYYLWGIEDEAAPSIDPAPVSFANDLERQW